MAAMLDDIHKLGRVMCLLMSSNMAAISYILFYSKSLHARREYFFIVLAPWWMILTKDFSLDLFYVIQHGRHVLHRNVLLWELTCPDPSRVLLHNFVIENREGKDKYKNKAPPRVNVRECGVRHHILETNTNVIG